MAIEEIVDPDDLCDIAEQHHQAGRLAEAEKFYQQVLHIDPGHPGALYFLGGIAYEDGRYKLAFDLVNRLILDEPNDVEALHLLGLIAAKLEKFPLAIELINKALTLQPAFVQAHFSLANLQKAQGQLDAAVVSFRRALTLNPQWVEAHYVLGQTLLGQGKLDGAVASFRDALALKPDFAEIHFFLGITFKNQGQLDAAIASYQQAIALKPDFIGAHINLANAQLDRGQSAEALASYRQALAFAPDLADVHNYLGLALKRLGRLDEAITSFQRALVLKPDAAEWHANLASALKEDGQLDAAIVGYERALALKPDFAELHNDLANALAEYGRLDAAIASYQRALSFKPDLVMAHCSLGTVLHKQRKHDEAIGCHRRALALDPDFAVAHNNLGVVLQDQGNLNDALESYQRAITLQPNLAEAYSNLGNVLRDQGQLDEAVNSLRRAITLKKDYVSAFSNYLMTVQYLPDYSRESLFSDHMLFGERFEAPLRAKWPTHVKINGLQRPLKVGFVSGDLGQHPVGFFLEGVLRHIDRRALEIILYPSSDLIDALTDRLRAMGFAWNPLIGLSDDAAAQRIQADHIDILIDLSGHTSDNRLLVFARKPAPVQVAWLGYWATTGLQAIDYILCDRHGIPADEARFYVEKPWYLPNTRLCFTPPTDTIAVGALPALRNGYITFGCFNNLTKMTDAVVALWARILHSVTNARLFLKSKTFIDIKIQQAVLTRFAAHGITSDRLLLEGKSPRAEYFAAYHRVDIALDPFPFTGGTTSVEGLWMGVPVITRRGDRMIAHQGESILHNVALSDWIAADDEAYLAQAVARSQDLTRLAALRAQLRSQLLASPLCDAELFARNLAAAFQGMWQQYCTAIE